MLIPRTSFSLIIFFLCVGISFSQEKEAGPIIEDYGKVWPIDDPDYVVSKELVFKAVFDVMNSPESHNVVNPSIETVARYLNMHAQSGVPKDQLKAALIIHNKASKDVMNNAAYTARYGVNNPNAPLIEQLIEAGVEVIFCGQSSLSRNIPKDHTINEVKLSLSAMTALIQLQDQGFRLIKF